MKKGMIIALGVLLAMLLPGYGYTQSKSATPERPWGGFVLGGGLFEHDGEGADLSQSSLESKPGFIAGGHLSHGLHSRLAFHAELLFAMKGSHDFALGERRASYTLHYLELPLLARVSLPSIMDAVLPFMIAGPSVSFLLSASGEDVQGQALDLDGVWKTLDFGVVFAAGVDIPITPFDLLGLEARYDMGLRAVVNDRDTINNRGILLVLSYRTCICSRND